MPLLRFLLDLAASAMLLASLPLMLELLVLSGAAVWPARKLRAGAGADTLRLCAIVPAHNEERLVGACVRSLRTAATPGTRVLVVAHNCTDATAANAAAAGAEVLALLEESNHGKGAALDFGFRHALATGADAVLVIDADSVVSPGLPQGVAAALAGGAQAVQCRYVAAGGAISAKARLLGIALLGMNVVRPRGRSRLRLSCGIFGNGFALSAATLRRVPYTAHSVVEDLEYHLLLLQAGMRVDFLDSAEVRGEMPETGTGAASQRARWEGGRQLMRRTWAGPLLRDVVRGHVHMAEPLLDLLSVPLATGVLLVVLAAVIARGAVQQAAALGVFAVLLYVTVAAMLGDDPAANARALLGAPLYLLFKLRMRAQTRAAGRVGAAWVRTKRNDDSEAS